MTSFSSGIDRIFSSVMQYVSSNRTENSINPDYVIAKLESLNYRSQKDSGPILKSNNSRNLTISFEVAGNLGKNLSTALPDQFDATSEDMVDIKGGYGAAILGMSVTGKMSRGIGNIIFSYTTINGEISDWELIKKTTNGKTILYLPYTKKEAIDYLTNNKDKIYESKKEFNSFLDKLD